MAKTNAEYQREHRQRQAERIAAFHAREAALEAALEAAVAESKVTLAAQKDEIARLEREIEGLYATLAASSPAPESARARTPDCPHPAHLVDGDRCGGCGQVVDSW